MPSLSQLQTWLDEAYAARHKLSIGKLARVQRFGERMQEYNASNAQDLNAYIDELNRMIAEAQSGKTRRRVYRVTQTGTGL
jgi:hypothetical protein